MALPHIIRSANGDQYPHELASVLGEGQRVYDPSYALSKDPLIWEKAQQDAVVSGCIERALLSIAGHEWGLSPASDDEVDVKVASILEEIIRKTPRFYEARRNLAEARFLGTAFAQVTGHFQGGKFGDGKRRRWWVPGKFIDIDRRRIRAISDRMGKEQGAPFYFRWEVFSPARRAWEPIDPRFPMVKHVYADNESRLGFGRGIMDSIYFATYIRAVVQREGLQGLKRWAQGMLVAKVGLEAAGGIAQTNEDIRDAIKERLLDMVGDNVLVIGEGDSVEVHQTTGTGDQIQERMMQRIERELTTRIEGTPLSTMDGDGGGAYALGQEQGKREHFQRRYDRESLAESMTRGFVQFVFDMNRPTLAEIDPRFAEAECPEFDIREERIEDPRHNAETAQIILGSGVELSMDEYYERVGWRKPEEGEETVAMQQGGGDPFGMGGMGGGDDGFGGFGGFAANGSESGEDGEEGDDAPPMAALAALLRAAFDESKVKRDKGGKFSSKEERGGGSSGHDLFDVRNLTDEDAVRRFMNSDAPPREKELVRRFANQLASEKPPKGGERIGSGGAVGKPREDGRGMRYSAADNSQEQLREVAKKALRGIKLPDKPERFFDQHPDAIMVPVDSLHLDHVDPERVKNAAGHMQRAFREGSTREPIAVRIEGLTPHVADGNSTVAVAAAMGWRKVPALPADHPDLKMNRRVAASRRPKAGDSSARGAAEFDESKVKRDKDGKFSKQEERGGGVQESTATKEAPLTQEEKNRRHIEKERLRKKQRRKPEWGQGRLHPLGILWPTPPPVYGAPARTRREMKEDEFRRITMANGGVQAVLGENARIRTEDVIGKSMDEHQIEWTIKAAEAVEEAIWQWDDNATPEAKKAMREAVDKYGLEFVVDEELCHETNPLLGVFRSTGFFAAAEMYDDHYLDEGEKKKSRIALVPGGIMVESNTWKNHPGSTSHETFDAPSVVIHELGHFMHYARAKDLAGPKPIHENSWVWRFGSGSWENPEPTPHSKYKEQYAAWDKERRFIWAAEAWSRNFRNDNMEGLSEYALRNTREFIAEVWTRAIYRYETNPMIEAIYYHLGGPDLPGRGSRSRDEVTKKHPKEWFLDWHEQSEVEL